MKKIAVLFHLTALGQLHRDNRPTNINTQSWPVMESQSQQCLTTSQNFFIMLLHTNLLVHGVVGLLFVYTYMQQHTSVPRMWWEDGLFWEGAHIAWTNFGGRPPPLPPLPPCYRPILNERLAYSRFFVRFHKFRFLQCKL